MKQWRKNVHTIQSRPFSLKSLHVNCLFLSETRECPCLGRLARPRAVPTEYVIPSAGRHVSLLNHLYITIDFLVHAHFTNCG